MKKLKKFLYNHKTFFYTLFIIAATSFVINNVITIRNAIAVVNNINNNTTNDDISTRIQVISEDLLSLSSELSSIQNDLEQRINFVAYLKKETETAENLLSLSSEQLEAIRTEWEQTIDLNSKKSLGQNLIINLTFFILGLIIPTIRNSLKKETNNKSVQVNEDMLKKIIQQAIDTQNKSENTNSSTKRPSSLDPPRRPSSSDVPCKPSNSGIIQRPSNIKRKRKSPVTNIDQTVDLSNTLIKLSDPSELDTTTQNKKV